MRIITWPRFYLEILLFNLSFLFNPVAHTSDRVTGPLQNVTWYLSVISINMPQWDFNEFRIIAHGTLSQRPCGFLLVTHWTWIEFSILCSFFAFLMFRLLEVFNRTRSTSLPNFSGSMTSPDKKNQKTHK